MEDMAQTLGAGIAMEREGRVGFVAHMVVHSKGHLQVARSHILDLAEALLHTLGGEAQVGDGHIGCMVAL